MGKWNLYDSGTRVPFIAAWPGKIDADIRTDAMVSWVDIIATLINLTGGKVPTDIDGTSFADVLLGKAKTHRDKIFTTHTGDGAMNIFPIRSVRIGRYKYIHNLRRDTDHTNHSDRHRKDGAGGVWASWDDVAETDPQAAAMIKRYYTRPKEEFFDLEEDPLELHNLADSPEHQNKIKELKSELAAWTAAQRDELVPHREPYLTSRPLPILKPRERKK